ncbi:hypothetical protein BDR26DRAFT_1009155 [Obelidium mucronatum]|nr:hypothetical protein BDR26DRAFT_1009155 [Obelidium mucronatum]
MAKILAPPPRRLVILLIFCILSFIIAINISSTYSKEAIMSKTSPVKPINNSDSNSNRKTKHDNIAIALRLVEKPSSLEPRSNSSHFYAMKVLIHKFQELSGADVLEGFLPKQEVRPRRVRRGDSERVEGGQDTWSAGWAADAHKNLPGFKILFKQFPNADWYLMVDDDSYLMIDNLAFSLRKFNASEPYYFGQANKFIGCDDITKFEDSPNFAQGGTGIVISRGAMIQLMDLVDECIIHYRECWGGDIRVSLCLRDANIFLQTLPGFHGEPPNKDFSYNMDPCELPISFHHALPKQMQKLFQLEKATESDGRLVTMGDVYQVFASSEPRHVKNAYIPGGHFTQIQMDHEDKCRQACFAEADCVAWDFAYDKQLCFLKDHPHRIVGDLPGYAAGVFPARYNCTDWSRESEELGDSQ